MQEQHLSDRDNTGTVTREQNACDGNRKEDPHQAVAAQRQAVGAEAQPVVTAKCIELDHTPQECTYREGSAGMRAQRHEVSGDLANVWL